MNNNWFVLPDRNCIVHILEQINIDRVHYTANVNKIQNNGKIRMYCYDDEIPQWRFANPVTEEPFVLEYVNSARLTNESIYMKKGTVYGILNTTDNFFRIKDVVRETEVPGNESKKKSKGFICIDTRKDVIIRYLYEFDIQPPEILRSEFGNAKRKDMFRYLKKMNIQLPVNSKKDAIPFFYIWLHGNMRKQICASLKAYFINNDLLFIK